MSKEASPTNTASNARMEVTPQPSESSCTISGIDCWTFVGIIAIIAIIATAIALFILRTKSKKNTAKKSTAKDTRSSSSDNLIEIYVGNLSYDMTDSQLRKEFERFGIVKSARVITHRANGKSKGYGFVEMPHRKEANISIKALDNTEVLGRRIRVNEARANTRPSER